MVTAKESFRFEDPRHEQIYRRLMLVGPGPASFYKDACKIMAESELESATHFVAHSLREIESSLRDVLESIGEQKEAEEDKGKRSGDQNHAEEIRSILKALCIEEGDPVAQTWLRLPGSGNSYGLHTRAHRSALGSPRKLDEHFRKFWDEFNAVLDIVLDRFESRYLESHRILDELLEKETPTDSDLKTLLSRVPNNAVSFRYFFDNLNTPEWLQPLSKEGLFKDPPAPDRDMEAGTVSYPLWPQSRYLARMADMESNLVKEAVFGIAIGVQDKGNLNVQRDLLDIAQSLSPELAKAFVPKAKEWLKTPYLPVADKLTGLIAHLARGGQLDSALDLAMETFAVEVEQPPPVELPEDDVYEPIPVLRPRLEFWEYKTSLQKVISELAVVGQERTLQWISDLLDATLHMSTTSSEKDKTNDYSYIWRPLIENHEQNLGMDVRHPLVSAVRDVALKLLELEPEKLLLVVDYLEGCKWPVFRRIALYLLDVQEDAPLNVIAQRLTSKELLNDSHFDHEYAVLLKSCFAQLGNEEQANILKYIEQGPPYLDHISTRDNGQTGEEMSAEAAARSLKRWQRDKLAPISEVLPPAWHKRNLQLVEEFGEVDVGPASTMVTDDLRSWTVSSIVDFLSSWQPSEDSRRTIEAPSRGGFARILTNIVQTEPVRFATEATRFKGLDATYVRGILSGFEGAAREKRAFPWQPVIDLASWATAEPLEIQGRESGYLLDADPSWSWARKQIAELLSVGFDEGPCEIPFQLRPKVWNILKQLTEDPEPTPEYEAQYGNTKTDPATLALSTVRGQAMYVAIYYGLWVRRNIQGLPDKDRGISSGFDELPQLRDVLAHHLDSEADSSVAVRSVYGRCFPWLVLIDADWCQQNLGKIFPTGERLRVYRDSAWETYIIFCRPSDVALDVLKEQYEQAIERIGQGSNDWGHLGQPDEHLAEHLLTFFGGGQIGLETGGLLDRFYARASKELCIHGMGFVGRMLNNSKDMPTDWIERFKGLWMRRVEAVGSDPDSHGRELSSFGWWFASGKFEDVWALEELRKTLKLARAATPEHMVLERLASVSATYPVPATECLRLMVEGERDPWSVHTWRKEIRQILTTALTSGDHSAKQAAVELINRLGARGHLDFADLI